MEFTECMVNLGRKFLFKSFCNFAKIIRTNLKPFSRWNTLNQASFVYFACNPELFKLSYKFCSFDLHHFICCTFNAIIFVHYILSWKFRKKNITTCKCHAWNSCVPCNMHICQRWNRMRTEIENACDEFSLKANTNCTTFSLSSSTWLLLFKWIAYTPIPTPHSFSESKPINLICKICFNLYCF